MLDRALCLLCAGAYRRPLAVLGFALVVATASCGDPEVVVPDVLLPYVQPPHGSVGISTRVEGLISFNHAVQDPAEVEKSVRLECRGAPPCDAPVASGCPATAAVAAVSYDPTTQLARVKADRELAPDTCYAYIVSAGITAADEHVGPLPFEVRSSFQTR